MKRFILTGHKRRRHTLLEMALQTIYKCMRPKQGKLKKKKSKGAEEVTVKAKVIYAAKAFPLDATAGVHAKLWALIKSDNAARVVCITNV